MNKYVMGWDRTRRGEREREKRKGGGTEVREETLYMYCI